MGSGACQSVERGEASVDRSQEGISPSPTRWQLPLARSAHGTVLTFLMRALSASAAWIWSALSLSLISSTSESEVAFFSSLGFVEKVFSSVAMGAVLMVLAGGR